MSRDEQLNDHHDEQHRDEQPYVRSRNEQLNERLGERHRGEQLDVRSHDERLNERLESGTATGSSTSSSTIVTTNSIATSDARDCNEQLIEHLDEPHGDEQLEVQLNEHRDERHHEEQIEDVEPRS